MAPPIAIILICLGLSARNVSSSTGRTTSPYSPSANGFSPFGPLPIYGDGEAASFDMMERLLDGEGRGRRKETGFPGGRSGWVRLMNLVAARHSCGRRLPLA